MTRSAEPLILLFSRRPFPVRHESDNSDSPNRTLSLLSLLSLNASGTKQLDFLPAGGHSPAVKKKFD
nr:MAG TPA: hypothetical protein [Caudoviricetes sp.]